MRPNREPRDLGAEARLPPTLSLPPAPVPPSCCEQEEPTYFAIWGDNKAFNEVIISPAMLHEHLPYVVMEGLNKVSPWAAWAVTPPQSPAVLCGPEHLGLPRTTGEDADAQRSGQNSSSGPCTPAVPMAV